MGASPTIGMLRPALELAWAVGKVGDQVRPAIPAPGRLRPLMRFAKLPDRALTIVRQVVEEDDTFRLRVAEIADEAALGRPAWLWLVRPEGWEADLGALAEAADAAASAAQDQRDERSARRRLEAAEEALARAEAESVKLREVNVGLAAEVAAERQARRRAEAERDNAATAHASDRSERGRLEAALATLTSRMASLQQEADDAAKRLADSGHQQDGLRAEVLRLTGELRTADAEAARLSTGRDQLRVATGDAVSRAATAARGLGSALADVARLIGVDHNGPDSPGVSAHRVGDSAPATTASQAGRTLRSQATGNRRRPASLPPAVFDDSIEAARHLVRVTGILLVVDGYNVTISAWPGLELPRQRHRLVDALAELAMRAGTSVHVVFDGGEGEGRFDPPAAARRKMRVTFSPADVDADEVIIDLVERVDPSQPVVVATDDRRVRDEVARRGANVISVAQLLAVLGRAPDSTGQGSC